MSICGLYQDILVKRFIAAINYEATKGFFRSNVKITSKKVLASDYPIGNVKDFWKKKKKKKKICIYAS